MKETKYTVKYTTSFKKDYKRAIQCGLKIELPEQVAALLAMCEPLPDQNRDHDLSGDWAGHRECHILPDWLPVYRIEDDVLVLTLARSGTRSDLFGKYKQPAGMTAREGGMAMPFRPLRSSGFICSGFPQIA